MKALSVQVQPSRGQGMDLQLLQARFGAVAENALLVKRHQFDRGYDKVEYLNFTFGTDDLRALWSFIEQSLYEDEQLRGAMAAASMAMCEGQHGWNDYLLLYHFDPTVKTDAL